MNDILYFLRDGGGWRVGHINALRYFEVHASEVVSVSAIFPMSNSGAGDLELK